MSRVAKMLGMVLSGVLLAAASSAWAEEPAAQPPRDLLPTQLSTFARMVGAPESEVAARLAADAKLRGVALRAVEAREERRSSAKNRAVAGFVILGVGDIVGSVIILSTPGYPNVQSGDTGRVLLGVGVAVASLGVGLGIAIPGLVSLGRQSSTELQASAEYRQQPLPTPATDRPSPTSARGAVLPLLSFSF